MPVIPKFEPRPVEFVLNATPGKFRIFAAYETRPRTISAVATISDADTAPRLVAAMNTALAGLDNSARLDELLAGQPDPVQASVRAVLPTPHLPADGWAARAVEVELAQRQEAARFLGLFPTLPCAERCTHCRACRLSRFTANDAWSVAHLAEQEASWLLDEMQSTRPEERSAPPSAPRDAVGLPAEWYAGLVAAYQRVAADLCAGVWPTPTNVAEQWALATMADEHEGGSPYWNEIKDRTSHPAWPLLRPDESTDPDGLVSDLLPEVRAAADRLKADSGVAHDVVGYLEYEVPFTRWFTGVAA